jgi:ABC-type molybdate transport system substrate-binding protein
MNKIILLGAIAVFFWLWRAQKATARGDMSITAAARLLEVPLTSDVDTVIAAHKRLIARVHPDAGGSAELAAQVNQARDVLLANAR